MCSLELHAGSPVTRGGDGYHLADVEDAAARLLAPLEAHSAAGPGRSAAVADRISSRTLADRCRRPVRGRCAAVAGTLLGGALVVGAVVWLQGGRRLVRPDLALGLTGGQWPAPAAAPAAPAAACAGDFGEDCRASMCCRNHGMTCYEKDARWASCKPRCTPGIDPFDIDTTPWSCRVLGGSAEPEVRPERAVAFMGAQGPAAEAPAETAAASACSGDFGEDCRASKNCCSYGMTCYEKDAWWASCKPNCIPGIDPFDKDKTPWSCRVLGGSAKPEVCSRVLSNTSYWAAKVMHEAAAATSKECRAFCERTSGCGVWTFHAGTGRCMVAPREKAAGFVHLAQGPSAPQPVCQVASDDLPSEACAAAGADCSRSRCCAAPGQQCYGVGGDAGLGGRCRTSCEPDGERSCTPVGPRFCQACQPMTTQRLAVVIPTFERDLCKLAVLARSLAMHDAQGVFGDIYVLWVSDQPLWRFSAQMEEVRRVAMQSGKRLLTIIDFSWQLQNPACKLWTVNGSCASRLNGWYAQMSLKLKVATLVPSEYYVVLDSKNLFLREVQASMFLSGCNTASIWGRHLYEDIPKPHRAWYQKSAELLGITDVPNIYWPTSITPAVLHKASVIELLRSINEGTDVNRICDGPLCSWLGMGATEFTLYYQFVASRSNLQCIHAAEVPTSDAGPPLGLRRTVMLWRGYPPSMNYDSCRTVSEEADDARRPLIFGMQSGVLREAENASNGAALQEKITDCVLGVYRRAGIFNPPDGTARSALAECFA